MTEDEMVGWHHQLDGHEFEQVLGVGDGQGSPACCSPWGCKELYTTQRLINNTARICPSQVQLGKTQDKQMVENSNHHRLKINMAVDT